MSLDLIAARAPNHLGDGVVAISAMNALSKLGRLVIYGPRWAGDLYRDIDAEIRPRGLMAPVDIAVLFPPSLRAALEALLARRRVGTPTDGRRYLLTDVVAPGRHTFDTYRSLVSAIGARIDGPAHFSPREDDPEIDVPEGHIGLNPVSVSGDVRQWPGFAALAERLPGPVVIYGGPGEERRVAERAGSHPLCVGASLPAFARALRRCRLFVSNDSGAAHFARAIGVRVLVIYGSTEPARTGPIGAHAIIGPRVRCAPCYARVCHRPADRGRHACFDLSVDEVLTAINAALRAT